MSTIRINNQVFQGNSLIIENGKVIVNGKNVTPEDEKTINIYVTGDVDQLSVDECSKAEVKGNVQTLQTMSADVGISGNVSGSVTTMSGDVDCGNVSGSITTLSGNVKHRKQ